MVDMYLFIKLTYSTSFDAAGVPGAAFRVVVVIFTFSSSMAFSSYSSLLSPGTVVVVYLLHRLLFMHKHAVIKCMQNKKHSKTFVREIRII
jgi:hypothetical protein